MMKIKCYDFTEQTSYVVQSVHILDAAFDRRGHLLVWVAEADNFAEQVLNVKLVEDGGTIELDEGYLKTLCDSMGHFWHVITKMGD